MMRYQSPTATTMSVSFSWTLILLALTMLSTAAALMITSNSATPALQVDSRRNTRTTGNAFILDNSRSMTRSRRYAAAAASSAPSSDSANKKKVVVISPPGGVGEVTAVKAASMGHAVRWFVVSAPPSKTQPASPAAAAAAAAAASRINLAQETLDAIKAVGGSVQLAGADAASLLLPPSDPQSALAAVSSWCGSADTLVCTFDGTTTTAAANVEFDENQMTWRDAIKVAAQEASRAGVTGNRLAVIAADDMEQQQRQNVDGDGEDDASSMTEGIGNLVSNLLGGGDKVNVPESLVKALSATSSSSSPVTLLRHGQLFGLPESSPNFSPFVGGPKKMPELCEEYSMRTVRVDPTISASGSFMLGSNSRSSRHAVGEAAVLLAVDAIATPTVPARGGGIDVCVSSQRGVDPTSIEMWEKEFARAMEQTMASSSSAGQQQQQVQLFSSEFSSVPDIERLANWLATKWAPAILRTYDIATMRTGARPVLAQRSSLVGGGVEIIWQELVDFNAVHTGSMLIEVTDTGLTAYRAPGDSSRGFGSVSRRPLPGEDVLVRQLAEAASQAIDKGLANKPSPLKQKAAAATAQIVTPTPAAVTSIQSVGTIEEKEVAASSSATATATAPKPPAAVSSPDTSSGPRISGARRSKERVRGKAKSRKGGGKRSKNSKKQ